MLIRHLIVQVGELTSKLIPEGLKLIADCLDYLEDKTICLFLEGDQGANAAGNVRDSARNRIYNAGYNINRIRYILLRSGRWRGRG